jgi:hypothetical protein
MIVNEAAPEMVGLCPSAHLGEFYVPLTEAEVKAGSIRCPECECDLLVYTRAPVCAASAEDQ